MRFRDTQAVTPPPATLVLPPSAWSSTYPARPSADVALGLRLLSHGELLTAHAEATKEAAGKPDAAFRFDEALVCWTVAAALCDPNDAGKPYFQRADEEVREAFPPETLRHLWHELERLQVSLSPVRPEATDAESLALASLLGEGVLARLSAPTQGRLRRLLRFCLDELVAPADA